MDDDSVSYERRFREAMDRIAAQASLIQDLIRQWRPGDSEARLAAEVEQATELCRAIPGPPPIS